MSRHRRTKQEILLEQTPMGVCQLAAQDLIDSRLRRVILRERQQDIDLSRMYASEEASQKIESAIRERKLPKV